jgi:hypothetical protein
LVAQLGRALSWYGKDRWFKSSLTSIKGSSLLEEQEAQHMMVEKGCPDYYMKINEGGFYNIQ